jgi:hypothetical protein
MHVFVDVGNLGSGTFPANAELTLSLTGSEAQTSGVSAGDSDADGYGDLLIASSSNGGAELILGQSVLSAGSTASFALTNGAGGQLGYGTTGGGDFDGDGNDDIAFHTGSDDIYLFYGGASGSLDVDDDADAMFTWTSYTINPGMNAQYGHPIDFGDFDGDGLDDLAIGMPGDSSTTWVAEGSVFIIPGQ